MRLTRPTRGPTARVKKTDDIILGTKLASGREELFALSIEDRRHHTLAVGKSGVGKSTLLFNMVMQDIYAGRGVAVLDPHGDLCEDILAHIPSARSRDVVYFDPADAEYPVSLNLLQGVGLASRDEMIDGVISAFKGTWDDFFGPRMERLFRNALAALYYCQNASLLGVERMLVDEKYRAWVVRQVKDVKVRQYWLGQFERLNQKTQAEYAEPILNKIDAFLLPHTVRNIVGQTRKRIDARFMMDHGSIFLANLSKGKIGADRASLLGSLWITQFQIAAMSRVDSPQAERRDFFLFVDEWQSFLTKAFTSVLSECRKYRLCLTLANQYFGQIDRTVLDAVFGNVSSIVAFRVGHADAEISRVLESSRLSSVLRSREKRRFLAIGHNNRGTHWLRKHRVVLFSYTSNRKQDVDKRTVFHICQEIQRPGRPTDSIHRITVRRIARTRRA